MSEEIVSYALSLTRADKAINDATEHFERRQVAEGVKLLQEAKANIDIAMEFVQRPVKRYGE
jgi:hypothetical protein